MTEFGALARTFTIVRVPFCVPFDENHELIHPMIHSLYCMLHDRHMCLL